MTSDEQPTIVAHHHSSSRSQDAVQQNSDFKSTSKRNSIPIYTSITQFDSLQRLSSHGTCKVFRGVCRATGLRVAIKRFEKRSVSAKEAVHIAREVYLMGILKGEESIIQIYGFFEDSAFAYVVMELCSGMDLYQRLVAAKRFDESYVARKVVYPLLKALDRLHNKHQVVHRDIKPENILLTGTGDIKLADFGSAIKKDSEVPFLPVGTLDFMAPEVLCNTPPRGAVESPCATPDMLQLAGLIPYNEKVDIWSLGVLTFELVMGKPPFYHQDPSETKRLIRSTHPPWELQFPKQLRNSPLASFLRAALTKDPKSRPSAAQLLNHEWIATHVASTGTYHLHVDATGRALGESLTIALKHKLDLKRGSTVPAPSPPITPHTPAGRWLGKFHSGLAHIG